MKTVAVIVHRGPHHPTVELATRLDASPAVAQVTIVANDRSTRPDHLPAAVAWILPPRDLGTGGGFQLASRDYPAAGAYLLIDNRVRIDDMTISSCLDLLAGTNIGVVAPTLVGGVRPRSGLTRRDPLWSASRARRPPGDRPHETDWVSGAVVFIKAECLRRVSLDSRYFVGFENIDFCYRVREAGWSVVLSPHRAWRIGSTALPTPGETYYLVRNRLWFMRLHGWWLRTALIALAIATVDLPRTAVADHVHRRGTEGSLLVLHGLLDGLATIPPPGEPRVDEPRAARWTAWR